MMSVRFGRSFRPLAISASCLALALLTYAASPLVTAAADGAGRLTTWPPTVQAKPISPAIIAAWAL